MTINAIGIICPACGEELGYLGDYTWRPTWIGQTRTIHHMCDMNFANFVSYTLLFDEDDNFVGIIPGADRFLDRAGHPVYIVDVPEDSKV